MSRFLKIFLSFNFCFFVFVSIARPVLASDWVQFAQSNGINFFIDESSLINKNGDIFYWIKFKDKKGIENKAQYMTNCQNKTISFLYFVSSNSKGELVQGEVDRKENPIIPSSVGEFSSQYACESINLKTENWHRHMNNAQLALLNKDYPNAEVFFRNGINEAAILSQNGLGEYYLVKTYLPFADFYENVSKFKDAIQLYSSLNFMLSEKSGYISLINQNNQKIQDLKQKQQFLENNIMLQNSINQREQEQRQKYNEMQRNAYNYMQTQQNRNFVNNTFGTGVRSILNQIGIPY